MTRPRRRLAALFERDGARIAAVVHRGRCRPTGLLLRRRGSSSHTALRELARARGAADLRRGHLGLSPRPRRCRGAFEDHPRPGRSFGKVIGGVGCPSGRSVARAPRWRAWWRHLGDTYQAGTLSGNPVAMTAGLATLELLEREHGWQRLLEALGAELEAMIASVLAGAAFPLHFLCGWARALLADIAAAGGRAAPPPRLSHGARNPRRFARLFHAMLPSAAACTLPPLGLRGAAFCPWRTPVRTSSASAGS